QSPSIAFDPAIGKLVLFGGLIPGQGPSAETWTFDGTGWTQLHPPVAPAPREEAAMAYDAARGNLVLFGGANGTTTFGDTWTFDGTTWTQLHPATRPSKAGGASLAYDPVHRQVMMFGGLRDVFHPFLDDTWTWDGSNWT